MLEIDFKEELAQLERVKVAIQQRLAETPEDTPHPECDCGRTLNEHLTLDIQACDVLTAALNGDLAPLDAEIVEYGPRFIFYACTIANQEESEADLNDAIKRWLRKIGGWIHFLKNGPTTVN